MKQLRSIALGLVFILFICGCNPQPEFAERDAAHPDVLLLIVDDLNASAWVSTEKKDDLKSSAATDKDKNAITIWQPEMHWADRPLILALPVIAVSAQEAGYETIAFTAEEPPGVARELPFVFDELVSSEELDLIKVRLTEPTERPRFFYVHLTTLPELQNFMEEINQVRATPLSWIITKERTPCGLEPGCESLHPQRRHVPLQFRTHLPFENPENLWTSHVELASALAHFFESDPHEWTEALGGSLEDAIVMESGSQVAIAAKPYYFLDDPEYPRVFDLSERSPYANQSAFARARQRPELVERFRSIAQKAANPTDPENKERLEELRSLGYIQ